MTDIPAVQQVARDEAERGRISRELIQQMDAGHAHPDVIINEVFEACVEHHLTGPVFCIDYPSSLCPLTKRKAGQPEIAERFELYVQGMELANAYTELNDPACRKSCSARSSQGLSAEESMAKMDHDFVKALKVGMPPAGGLGIGIDRLVMLLTQQSQHPRRDLLPAAAAGGRCQCLSQMM